MTLQLLLDGVEVLSWGGDVNATGLEYDSRRVRQGDVFIAIKGEKTDGNRFIDAAITAGAVAIVTDSPQEPARPNVAWVLVTNSRRALARVSANFFHHPAEKLAITGITGTNGKTTTSFLMESILEVSGRKSALVGTIQYHIGSRVIEAPHTTPEALELNRLFDEALRAGATEAVMEVSSHALAQERVYGIPFDVGVFTNLTQDHLDYHGGFPEYFEAKRVLFAGCGTDPPRIAVINLDDEYGRELHAFCKKKGSLVFTYGLRQGDFCAEKLDLGAGGTRFDMKTPDVTVPIWSRLAGTINVYNILAAAAAAFARGCSTRAIADGVHRLQRVPGRFETVNAGQPFTVVVDYAHTDDALRNLTALAREFVRRGGGKGRVITVFGCGGDRDRSKRPLMGEAAGRGSDLVVLTSDNPRSEDPLAIINDVLPGLQRTGTKYLLEPDRRRAIIDAIDSARAGDIVLIAGKGHEKTQITRSGATPFDDMEVAREALALAGYTEPQPPANAGPVKPMKVQE
ncbi:MAG: UDP-N-acetylmuramoyl-L-alanyl-D-glutamate--2,6-diaminopimelate ligase [Terriglobales bacterium]